MPEYTIRDPRSHRTVTVRGESPPTEQELHRIFATVNAETAPASMERSAWQSAGDVAVGVGKGAANTAIGFGRLVNDYVPGVSRLNEAIYGAPVDRATYESAREVFATPQNTAQRIGFGAEQIGEFFLPVGAVGRLGQAAQIGKSGVLTLSQGGSPLAAGVSAGLTAAIPGASALRRASQGATRGAEQEMARALGATKEYMKTEAMRLAPEMLASSVRGSRSAMLETATANVARLGTSIGDEVAKAAKAGVTVDGWIIRGEIQLAKDGVLVANAAGQKVPIEGAARVAHQLDRLDTFVESLGRDIPVDKAHKIKMLWDRIVSKSGLYNQKAGATATDNATSWAVREGATAFRDLLNASPSLSALNQEFKFWKGMKDVLTATQMRTQAQSSGLASTILGGTGATVGALAGDTTSDRVQNAVLGGLAGKKLIQVVQSPAWRTTVTGPMKQKLAEALASGNAERVTTAVGRIVAATPVMAERP